MLEIVFQAPLGRDIEQSNDGADHRFEIHMTSVLYGEEAGGSKKKKIFLASIREEQNMPSLSTTRCAPGASHLIDSLTKNNPFTAERSEEALTFGRNSHGPDSFAVTSDVLLRTTVEWNDHNKDTDDSGLRSSFTLN